MNDLVDLLAAFRLTRLVTRDTITRPLRVRVIRRAYQDAYGPGDNWAWNERSEAEWDQTPETDDDAPKLAAFIICPWCVGLWISGFVVLARRYAPSAWEPLARVLAISSAVGLAGRLDE